MVINFDFKHGAKKSSYWDNVAKLGPNIFQYISIYFLLFYEKLVSSGFLPARPKTKKNSLVICIGLLAALILPDPPVRNPSKSVSFIKCDL